MNDLISRQAAIDALNKLSESTYEVDYGAVNCDDAINAIAALPPAEPKIVRCKNCEFWFKLESSVQGKCLLLGIYPASGWYCANGRMRGKQNG